MSRVNKQMGDISARLVWLVEEFMKTTKSAFAQKADLRVQTFQNYINGRDPSAESLRKLHDTYGVDLNWLVTGEGKPFLQQRMGFCENHSEGRASGRFLKYFKDILPFLKRVAVMRCEAEDGRNTIGFVTEFETGEFQVMYFDLLDYNAPHIQKEVAALKNIFYLFGIHLRQVCVELSEIEEMKNFHDPEKLQEIMVRAKEWLTEKGSLELIWTEIMGSKELMEIFVLLKEHASPNFLKTIRRKLEGIKELEDQS